MTGQLDRIRELEKSFRSENNILSEKLIAISSGKGGTGKTFFAANFAYHFALTKKVLLIDLDFSLSNLHLLFNFHTNNTLNSFFESRSLFNEIITEYNSNLHIVFGSSDGVYKFSPAPNDINRLLLEINKAAHKYDLIIFDLGAGINDSNLQILAGSGTKIIITCPEPTAIMDAYVLIKMLSVNLSSNNVYIAVNRCLSETDGIESFNNLKLAVSHFLKQDINFLLDIPESHEVRKSIIDQKLLAEYHPSSGVFKSFDSALAKISKFPQVFNINHSSSSASTFSFKNSL